MEKVTVKKLQNDDRDWYELNGTDYGTGYEFNSDVYGVTVDNVILDSDGWPLTEGDWQTIAVRNALKI